MSFEQEFFDRFEINTKHLTDRMALVKAILSSFSAIPYENISKILAFSQAKTLDDALQPPQTVWEGYLCKHLGGTCYSLTNLLRSILHHCGFLTKYFLADMKAGKNMHCGLIVVENKRMYLTDPGYLITTPIELLQENIHVKTSLTDIDIIYEEGHYHLYTTTLHGGRKWRYTISSIFDHDAPFLEAWKASYTPRNMSNLCLTVTNGKEQLYFQRDFTRISSRDEKKNIKISSSVPHHIADLFGIDETLVEEAYELTKEIHNGR